MTRWWSGRNLALGVVALVLIGFMVAMGAWQLSVFDERQQRDGAEQLRRPPVPMTEVMGPDDAYPEDAVGRPVTVQGRYVPGEQFYVTDLPGHDDDLAVVTPLADDSGSMILVVRGSVSRGKGAHPPAGRVVVEGVLEPSTAHGGPLDAARTTDGIRVAALVGGFSRDLYSGYVILRSSNPAEPLEAIEPPTPEPSLLAGLRNLAYALQWWVFAAFVGFMWWRIVKEDRADAVERSHASVG